LPGSSGSAVPWRLPLEGRPHVVRAFDPPSQAWLPGHRGVDLAASKGALVRAAGSGTVTWAGWLVDRGVVVVAHADGLRTTYEPVDPTVAVGDHVASGDVVATLGDGDVHCGSLPRCLHWGLRRGRDYLDPMLLVDPGHVVLLPP
jgi:murein DD-endopeptidase MepM/ murein hydrolase activator NlpD